MSSRRDTGLFSIGEFSKITGLTIKTLRFYQERGLLVPASVDPDSGYRFYDQRNIETARAIAGLRAYDFSLDEIAEILRDHSDDADLLGFLERRKATLQAEIANHRKLISSIDQIVQHESEVRGRLEAEGHTIVTRGKRVFVDGAATP